MSPTEHSLPSGDASSHLTITASNFNCRALATPPQLSLFTDEITSTHRIVLSTASLHNPPHPAKVNMGDVAVEGVHAPAHKKAAPSIIPTIDHFEGLSAEGGDDYATLKKLQRQLEYASLCVAKVAPFWSFRWQSADLTQIHSTTGRVHQG